MIIDQSELLRVWLSQVLQPLCDADPNALAKYVLALIRKDKEEDELRQCMIDQLDVFLQLETKGFVTRLFKVLKSKEYLSVANSSAMDTDSTSCSSGQDETNRSEGDSTLNAHTFDEGSSIKLADTSTSTIVSPSEEYSFTSSLKESSDDHSIKSNSSSSNSRMVKLEELKGRDRSRKNKSRSPRRSRSRSKGGSGSASASSGSRNTRDYRGRYRRPVQRQRYDRDVWDRRRSPAARNRSASPRRSPVRYRRAYGSRSRSRSPLPNRSPGSRDDKDSSRFAEQKGQDSQELKVTIKSMLQSPEEGTAESNKPEEESRGNRCRDYDEKGLCMRGDLCPFDHGINPVVLEDTRLGRLKNDYQVQLPLTYSPRVVRPRPMFGDPPIIDNLSWAQQYRPRSMMMMGRPGMMRFNPPPPHPRLLVDVPVAGLPPSHMPDMSLMEMDMSLRGMPRNIHPMHGYFPAASRGRGRGGFDRGRLGAKPLRNNCSLEVKKIPRTMNSIMELNGHFWKFGKIVNIQINFDNDPEAALVTFATPEEAYTAYKSTEAVMNNRFIRVFWHNKEKENEDGIESEQGISDTTKDPVENMDEGSASEKIIVSGNNITKTVYNHIPMPKKELSAERAEQVEAIKKSQEMLRAQETLRKAQEEKRKEAIKLMNNLKIRKGDMLREQLGQQKKLIMKLEEKKDTMSQDEKDEMITLMKTLQGSIESLKKDLDGLNKQPIVKPVRNNIETRKEILDAELDLYNKEIAGGDTIALQHKVHELRAQAHATGTFKRGRGSYRGFIARGRGGSMRSLRSVDRRTTKLLITGYPAANHSEVLNHFGQYGAIESFDTDVNTPSLTINYTNRNTAEMAKLNGMMFDGKRLNVQWVAKETPLTTAPVNANNGAVPRQSEVEPSTPPAPHEEQTEMFKEQVVVYENENENDQFEEEEDDEVERSWRR